MTSDPLIASLLSAVAALPEDVALRLHLAQRLAEAGDRDSAVQQAAIVLQRDPKNAGALSLISGGTDEAHLAATRPHGSDTPADETPEDQKSEDKNGTDEQILRQLDRELSELAPPPFLTPGSDASDYALAQDEAPQAAFDAETVSLRLADVGGMHEVKQRLEMSLLAPIRNPELGRLYGKTISGGLLLYGPPGCGKTFIARAIAGELGAKFINVSLADVLDMYIGRSEQNIQQIFEIARRNAPAVIFFDEVDAIGQKRTQLHSSAMRGSVNQLLTEMDGVNSSSGVFVLGATNHPWDVDVALRRPGRFDRMLLVLPPDEAAREAILRLHLKDRPIANIDTRKITKKTEGYSGADLAYICQSAAENALADSAKSGVIRMIEMRDLDKALSEIKPSIGPWLQTARNVAQFSNDGGTYDELLAYLRSRRLL